LLIFGYNRLGLNFSGPLVSKKDTVRGFKTPIMGFFISGDLIYQKDGKPAAFPLYRVTDDVLNSLTVNPLRLYGQNNAVFYNSEFLTYDQMQTTKSTLNTAGTSINISGKLDFRVAPTINLSFGGQFTWNDNRNFNYANSMMNWQNNSHSNEYTWRVNGRFTQRFPTAADSKSFVKNIYYSIGADFSRNFKKTEDAQHKDNFFEYGYVGSFATHTVRAYTDNIAYDSVLRLWGHLQNGKRDTIVIFKGSDLNPESASWTQQYFGLFDDPTGHYLNINEIISGKGLVNGMEPADPYGGMNDNLSGIGNRPDGYTENGSDQIAVNASFAADFGNHEIQIGLQYQQRKSSGYTNIGSQLWDEMYGLTNAQLKDLDLAHPQAVYRDGVYMDTINYFRNYVPTLQHNFDISLRKKLGLPVDGTDWIDLYSYDFANNSINYYDKNMVLHTLTPGEQVFSMDMFSAEEVLANGSPIVGYYGYDYMGKKLSGNVSFDDFFTQQDANGNYTRAIGPYQPIYIAGYIQDKFAFKDLIFNIGVRVDRFDANQPVLKDPYLFYPAKTVGEVSQLNGTTINHPSGMGSDYVVYVDDANNPTAITGYRNNSSWYNDEGSPITDPVRILDRGNGVQPYLVDPSNKTVQANVFQDYDPQTNWMPRISFSFPISDDALFYAHYDILTQRPSSAEVQIQPVSYYYIGVTGASGTINNPDLKPEKTIDYELGFQQKINNSSSLKLAVFYREMRDQIQQYRLSGAYPKTYYSYTNIDFGTVKGLTITYDLRRSGNARLRFNYTLQFADGTGSDPDAAQAIIRSDQPNLRTLNPLSFDRRHQFNISFDYRWGGGKDYNGPVINRKKSGKAPIQFLSNLGANVTLTGGSGTPYTQTSQIKKYGDMGQLKGNINGARLPWQFLISARFDKDFNFALNKKKDGTINVYIEFANLLNTQNVTNVYPGTGSASDDGYLTDPQWQNEINQQVDSQSFRDLYSIQMNNPYRYSSPRTIRLGLMFNF